MHAQHCFADVYDLLRNEPAVDYRKATRMLREIESPAAMRVAAMGNITLERVAPYLRVGAASVGQMADFQVAPFGQYMQHLYSDALSDFRPDIMLLVLSPEMMRPDGFARFHLMTVEERKSLGDSIVGEIADWIAAAAAQTSASLMVGNFSCPRSALGMADLASDYGEQEFYLDLNRALIRTIRGESRAHLLDLASAASRVGVRQAFDPRLQHLAKMPWTEPMMREIGQLFAHAVVGAMGLARKCLVLDLDNTLWGGVVGEDGPHGIRVGQGDVAGEAFHAFQLRIKALKERGILLALCSKNNPEDVEELFRLRGDMPLKLSDMAATAIGWQPKHEGVAQIAGSLNIGIDALVFMDDNPVEIAAMRMYRPEVQSVLLPPDPAGYVEMLDDLPWFEKGRLTAEDSRTTEHYALTAGREALKAKSDPDEYLRELDMKAVVRDATAADLLRVHQLFVKTNQFNLTTMRLGLGDIEQLIADDRCQVIVAQLRDKFGDLGMVAACVLRDDGAVMEIDHLMMSCRAMGRGLESVLMNDIKRRFLNRAGVDLLRATFRPTAKNVVISDYCREQGFAPISADAGTIYVLARDEVSFATCGWITLENDHDD